MEFWRETDMWGNGEAMLVGDILNIFATIEKPHIPTKLTNTNAMSM